MKGILFVAALLFLRTSSLAQGDSAGASAEIMPLARAFIVDLNLGDYEKMPAYARPEDEALLAPKAGGQMEAMLKLKELPQLAQIRTDLANLSSKVLVPSEPQLAADGKTAVVVMKMVPDDAKSFVVTKLIYTVFLKEAYRAQQAGTALPSLDIIQKTMQTPGTLMGMSIDLKVALLSRETPPSLLFEKTLSGWRMNMQDYFGKHP